MKNKSILKWAATGVLLTQTAFTSQEYDNLQDKRFEGEPKEIVQLYKPVKIEKLIQEAEKQTNNSNKPSITQASSLKRIEELISKKEIIKKIEECTRELEACQSQYLEAALVINPEKAAKVIEEAIQFNYSERVNGLIKKEILPFIIGIIREIVICHQESGESPRYDHESYETLASRLNEQGGVCYPSKESNVRKLFNELYEFLDQLLKFKAFDRANAALFELYPGINDLTMAILNDYEKGDQSQVAKGPIYDLASLLNDILSSYSSKPENLILYHKAFLNLLNNLQEVMSAKGLIEKTVKLTSSILKI